MTRVSGHHWKPGNTAYFTDTLDNIYRMTVVQELDIHYSQLRRIVEVERYFVVEYEDVLAMPFTVRESELMTYEEAYPEQHRLRAMVVNHAD